MNEDLSYRIIGCAMAVHNELGCGFQEVIYQRALSLELNACGIPHQREFEMPVMYKGVQVGTRRVDFFVDGKIMVELKSLTALEAVHLAQGKNYLEAYRISEGLLLNFGAKELEIKKLYNSHLNRLG